MKLSIIIPTKNRGSILTESLNLAFAAIKNIEAEILVINDSKSETIELSSIFGDKVKVFDNAKSGVASARNLGARKSHGELLLFLDDDMWIKEENLLTTIKLHREIQNACIILNWIYPPALDHQIGKSQFGRYLDYYGFTSLRGWCRGQYWNTTQLFPTKGISSQYLSIRKEDFWMAGGYNESFPHAGFEDHDFYMRLCACGIQPHIYPLSVVYHNEADRMDIKAWLARKKRGGETRKVAVEMGYSELRLQYGPFKKEVYTILHYSKPILFKALELIPNQERYDSLYFRIVNLLLGLASFEGYTAKE